MGLFLDCNTSTYDTKSQFNYTNLKMIRIFPPNINFIFRFTRKKNNLFLDRIVSKSLLTTLNQKFVSYSGLSICVVIYIYLNRPVLFNLKSIYKAFIHY